MAEWRNWAGDQRCTPAAIEHPRTREQLAEIVGDAARRARRVRASASGHSFTDIALTDGVMVRLDRLDRVLEVDREAGLVKVEAGIVLAELNRRLDGLGLAIENLGDIDRQSLAGSISTGTHGTGARFRSVSAQIEAVELVLADGSSLALGADDPGALAGARIGLGSLGLIYAVDDSHGAGVHASPGRSPTPARRGAGRRSRSSTRASTTSSSTSSRTPRSRSVARAGAPTSRRAAPASRRLRAGGDARELGRPAVRARRLGGSRRRSRGCRGSPPPGSGARPRSIAATGSSPPIGGSGSPRWSTGSRASTRPRRCAACCSWRPGPSTGSRSRSRSASSPPTTSLLSASHARDTCYVAVHQDRKLDWEPYFRGVEQIMDTYGGRPHWGKRHFQTAETLAPRYPRWDEFRRLRARLDPEGRFANAYTDRVLGTVAEISG